MKVIVTGSSSCLARPFLPRLCACDDVKEVIGIDWRPGSFKHHKFTPVRADIRDIKIAPLFAGTDLVYHLAFIVLRSSLGKARNNRELIRDINVNGSKRIFEMASTNKVKRLVHLSSSAVYGAWPDNPYSIDEYQTRRIMPDFSYSEDKNAVEDILDGLENKNPNMIITRLRPHVILGPNCQPFLRTLLQLPFYPALPKPEPLTQCVWEDDVCSAMILSRKASHSASYNIATDDSMPFSEMIKFRRKKALPLPYKALQLAHKHLWKFSSIAEEPGWFNGMQYPLTVSNCRAKQELGWHPTHSVKDCVEKL